MRNQKILFFDLIKSNSLIFGFLLILIFLTTSCATWYNSSLSNLPDYQKKQIYAQDKLECNDYANAESKGYCNSLAQTAADSNNALVKINAVTGCLAQQNLLFTECMKAKGWQTKKKEQNGSNEVNKCFNYLKSQNYQLALQAGKNAVELYPNSEGAHGCLGITYTKLGYFDLSIKELKTAEKLTNSKDDLGIIYAYIGDDYNKLGDLNNALLYFDRELEIERDLNNQKGESNAINNIAGVYEKQGDNNKAVEYYKKAIELDQKAGDYRGTAHDMLNLGNTYTDLKNFSEAEYYLTQGLEMVKKLGDKEWEALGYTAFGKLYLVQNQKGLAKEYFTKAYNLFKEIGNNNDAQKVYEKYLKQ